MQRFIIQFWRKHDDPTTLLFEVRERYKESPEFAQLLHAAVLAKLHGGEVTLEGKPNAQRVLRHVLDKLLEQERADVPEGKLGKWQYLELRPQPYTGKRVWQKVSRVRAWAKSVQADTPELPFALMRVLGYSRDITRKQATLIEKAHFPPFIVVVEEPEEPKNTSQDLDPNDNEHFRDDSGEYDDAGVLQPKVMRQQEGWENAYSTKYEVWNRTDEKEAAEAYRFGGRFYPERLWSKAYGRIDWHGAMRVLEYRHHSEACQRATEATVRRQALGPSPVDGSWWCLSRRERVALQLSALKRRQQLDADELEVQMHAFSDVSQTDLELLEEQVKATQGKVPHGLIAALASERLKYQHHAETIRQNREGLDALERAIELAPLPFAVPTFPNTNQKERLPAQTLNG